MSQAVETRNEDHEETSGTDVSGRNEEETRSKIQRMRDLDPSRLVEAALFTAGRPVGVDELAEATGLAPNVVKQAARSLEQEYEDRGDATALEVSMAGAKWAMQLKTVYVEHAQSLARMEIPKKTLKTLALIAFHQPLLQSELVDMIGSKTYEHVRELSEVGLVKSRPEGLSKRLSTSPEFPEYFGIPATDTPEIRAYLAKKVGLSPSELRGEADLDSFTGEPASPEEVEAAAREKEAKMAGTDATDDEAESEGSDQAETDGAEVDEGDGVDADKMESEQPVTPEAAEAGSPGS